VRVGLAPARSCYCRSSLHEGFVGSVRKVNNRASSLNVLLVRASYNQNREQIPADTGSMVQVVLGWGSQSRMTSPSSNQKLAGPQGIRRRSLKNT